MPSPHPFPDLSDNVDAALKDFDVAIAAGEDPARAARVMLSALLWDRGCAAALQAAAFHDIARTRQDAADRGVDAAAAIFQDGGRALALIDVAHEWRQASLRLERGLMPKRYTRDPG